MTNWNEIDQIAKEWIVEAAERIRSSFPDTLDIQTKSNPNDLVTNIDRETEEFFASRIRDRFPGQKILGEEGLGDELDSLDGIVWILDPIDGTMNFIHQQRNFMISLGIFENGENRLGYIYDVVHKELYSAHAGHGAYFDGERLPELEPVKLEEAIAGMNPTWLIGDKAPKHLLPLVKKMRGVRNYGSAAMELAYVATGRLDAYISLNLAPWDFAGGKVIVEELGGKMTKLDGKPLNLLEKGEVFAAKPGLFEIILNGYNKE